MTDLELNRPISVLSHRNCGYALIWAWPEVYWEAYWEAYWRWRLAQRARAQKTKKGPGPT